MYRRSQEIQIRLGRLIDLIRSGRHTTATLAAALGISVPTVFRCLAALRERGYGIRSVHNARGWAYKIVAEPAQVAQKQDA